ncbi:MAG: hypothetical protein CSA81_06805 [Acidobacteria bacterium]|nr:MAG: hypothetical protein CSA81_06805 [Acidobacteriota bacterium]
MNRRVLALLIFRATVFSLLALLQLLGPFVGIPPFPFEVFLISSLLILATNWLLYFLMTRKLVRGVSFHASIWFQILTDIFVLGLLQYSVHTEVRMLPLFYVIVILFSTIYLSRVSVYLVAIISFISFYSVLLFKPAGSLVMPLSSPSNQLLDISVFTVAGGYFIVFFTVALVANYLKKVFDANRGVLRRHKQEIDRLETIRKRIVENLPSGLLTVNRENTVTYANPAATVILESSEDLKGKNCLDVFPYLKELSPQLLSSRFEFDQSVNGHVKAFGMTITDTQWDDSQVGKLILFQDLTHIKQLEEQQLFSKKMAAIGKVAAGVAHEIRNPLAAVSGSVQVIGSLIPKHPTTDELLKIVQKETDRLNQIVNQFLIYAKPHRTDQYKEIDLYETVSEFLRIARADPDVQKHPIVFHGEPMKRKSSVNPEQLTQVLWNLIRNSCQASSEGEQIQIELSEEDASAKISVKDRGVGMTKEEVENVFTPFQRYRKGPGLGLGMSIVYEIIQLHSGRIEVDTKKDEGTMVSIYLPFSPAGSRS